MVKFRTFNLFSCLWLRSWQSTTHSGLTPAAVQAGTRRRRRCRLRHRRRRRRVVGRRVLDFILSTDKSKVYRPKSMD